jgi:arsenite transporter
MLPEINKILYATDLSESAKPAFYWAMSLAEQYDAAISIIHIIPDLIEEMSGSMSYDLTAHFSADQLTQFNDEGGSAAMAAVKERVTTVYEDMRQELTSCRVDLHHILVKPGDPVREIIAAVEEDNYDIVVMGTHGHGLLDGLLLGSVAKGVVHKCPTPVLTIKLPEH